MKSIKTFLLTAAIHLLAVFAFAQTWMQTSAPSTNWVSVASSTDGNKLVAAAYGGIVIQGSLITIMPGPIYTSTNSGFTWQETTAPADVWQSIASSADGMKLAAASIKIICTSTNSGVTWLQASNTPPNVFWSSIATSADGSQLIAATQRGSIYVSTNSGATWWSSLDIGLVYWSSVACSADGKNLMAAPNHGNVYSSTNSGITWMQVGIPGSEWKAVVVSADGTTFVAAGGGSIYVSTNSGITWFQSGAPIAPWQAVAVAADGKRLLASVNHGGIYTSPDSGVTWLENKAPNQIWTSVATSGDGAKLVAVVNGSGIYIPMLGISLSSGGVMLSWPANSNPSVLQQNMDLLLTKWADVTNPPVLNLTNLQNEVTLAPSNTGSFYRLKTP